MAAIKVYALVRNGDPRPDSIWLSRRCAGYRLSELRGGPCGDTSWVCVMYVCRDYMPGAIQAAVENERALEGETPSGPPRIRVSRN